MKGNFVPRGLKFFSRHVRDYPYYFLVETNSNNLVDFYMK